MERRRGKLNVKWSPMPVDYLKLVCEVFTTNFDEGLKKLKQFQPSKSWFEATGRIYPEEIVLAVSLMHDKKLAATTVYASTDFDPKASSPTIQDLLAACVDATGGVWGSVLDPKDLARLEQLADESMSALEDVPFEWTAIQVDKFRVFLKMDKSNPLLDQAADEWLAKNDPGLKKLEEETERETEKLFVTGKRAKGNGDDEGGGTVH
jgi:hypothetical protein